MRQGTTPWPRETIIVLGWCFMGLNPEYGARSMVSIQLWKNYGATIMSCDDGWEFISTEKLHNDQDFQGLWVMCDVSFKGLIDRLGISATQAVDILELNKTC